MTGNEFVDAISEIAFEGNIIPNSWFKELHLPDGKPDLNAIVILSEIVYWYRAKEDSDEVTGEKVRRKRFKADLLQRTYDSFVKQFGLTYPQVRDACHRLQERYGVIRLVVRKRVETETGVCGNMLYIAPVPEKIRSITHPQTRSHVSTGALGHNGQAPPFQGGRLPHSRGEASPFQGGTYTEITTEITTEKGERERTPTPAQEVEMPAQEIPPRDPLSRPTPTPAIRVPEGWQPSAETEAFLKERYPMLNFAEQMFQIRNTEFQRPKTDWDAMTKKWFSQEAEKFSWRKEKATVGPDKDNSGLRRDTTTTNKHSREIDRGHQLALETFYAAQEQQQAITIPYEDITHGDERLPRVSGVAKRRGGVLPPSARAGQNRPIVLSTPPTL